MAEEAPSRHEQILQALAARLACDPFFPKPELDAPEPHNFRTQIPGVQTAALGDFLSVQDGPLHVTRDGGAENSWELELEATVVYVVQGAAAYAIQRRARRDQGARYIASVIAEDRTLGTGDAQVYAEITEAERDDDVPLKSGAPIGIVRLTVCIQYVADSAAG